MEDHTAIVVGTLGIIGLVVLGLAFLSSNKNVPSQQQLSYQYPAPQAAPSSTSPFSPSIVNFY